MLEAIIDLLLSNIFFVILVIGGILSFFKRQIEKQNEQQQRPGRVGQRQQQQRSETISVPTEERARPERQWKERSKNLETNLQELYETKREELGSPVQEVAPRVKRPTRPKAQKKIEADF